MSGSQAGFAMYLSCDAMFNINAVNMQWLKQQFGWSNSIGIGSNEPRDFYNATSFGFGVPNNVAWLDQMDGSGRHPVVVTTGTNATTCWQNAGSYKLAGSVGTSPKGGGPACGPSQNAFFFCSETR